MKKLLVCDVEGTIFQAKYKIDGTDYASTMWQPLAEALGPAAIEEELATHIKWENKEYDNYIDWVEATVKIHRKYGLRRDVFYSLINGAEYVDGVVEFFENLDRDVYVPVLVSGGFEELIKRAMIELNINYGYGACEYFFDEHDGKLSGFKLKPCDFEDKYHHVEKLFKRYKVHPKKDWVFVGDGKNDVHIARRAPLSFGINTHPELAKIVSHNFISFHQIHEELKKPFSATSDFITREEELLAENKALKAQLKELKNFLEIMEVGSSKREERLSEEIFSLRTTIKALKHQLNEVKAEYNEIKVLHSDYTTKPAKSLKDILSDGFKVAFIGFHADDSQFKYFDTLHDNLKMYSGFNKGVDFKHIKHYDFFFEYIDCMWHTVGFKLDEFRTNMPHSKLCRHGSIDMLENAIANIMIRHFVITG